MDETKKLESFKTLSIGFHLAFKAYFNILDYCGLDLVNFHSIKKFFKYKLYYNLKRIALISFIILFICSIDRASIFFPIFFWTSICALGSFFILDSRIIKIFSYNEAFYRKQKKLLVRNIISIKILGNNELIKKGLNKELISGNLKGLEEKIHDFMQHKKTFSSILEKYAIIITILIPFISITFEILKNPSILSSFFNLISIKDIFPIFTIIFVIGFQVYNNSNMIFMKKKGHLLYLEAIYSTLTFVISAVLKSIEFPLVEIEKKDLEKSFEKLKEKKGYDISKMKDLENFFQGINALEIEGLKLTFNGASSSAGDNEKIQSQAEG